LDRSPVLAFSDEMSDSMLSRTTQMNIDHQMLFRPITKWTARIAPEKVKKTIYKALLVATSEVPGPVYIGLPAGGMALDEAIEEDVQFRPPDKIPVPGSAILKKMERLFNDSRKPVLALGITSVRARVRPLVLKLAEKYKVPVVLTPMAKGIFPEDHPSYAGVLAHALSNEVGKTHQQADLVVGIGFDPVEINYEDWMPNAPLIHIDTMPADLDRENFTLACDVVGDLKTALERLFELDCDEKDWDMNELSQRRKNMFKKLAPPPNGFGPRTVLAQLREALSKEGIMTCDVGAHLHLIGQQWQTPAPELQLMTNGCSSMGFAIPAAIAAKLCCPDRQVCSVVGDGGFLMMAGEMATAMRLGLPVVFLLMTDMSLSLIRIKQQKKGYPIYGTSLFGKDYISGGNFFGVPVLRATDAETCRRALEKAFAAEGPVIVEAVVDSRGYDELILKENK
jgi:acetolactate synthase-1/2/3 large subunit